MKKEYFVLWGCITFFSIGCMSHTKEKVPSLIQEATPQEAFLWEPFGMHIVNENPDRHRVIYVSADWCLTCVDFEQRVLLDSVVREKMGAKNVIAMRADMTKEDEEIASLLLSYNENILPVLIYIPAEGTGVSFSKHITKEAFLAVLAE